MKMKRKKIVTGLTVLLIFAMSVSNVFAIRLLTKEKALEEMFPDIDEVVTETRVMTVDEIAAIKGRLDGKLVYYQKGSKSKDVQEKTEITLYFGMKDGEKIGVAMIEEQPGKWGPVEYIIAMDNGSGKVKNMAVMSYKEKRGRPIARRNFLKQFFGKGSDDPLKVRKDIRAISGATISSDATCFAVKKVIAIYETVIKTELVNL
jgi:thiamine biosynthesis lipoprotein